MVERFFFKSNCAAKSGTSHSFALSVAIKMLNAACGGWLFLHESCLEGFACDLSQRHQPMVSHQFPRGQACDWSEPVQMLCSHFLEEENRCCFRETFLELEGSFIFRSNCCEFFCSFFLTVLLEFLLRCRLRCIFVFFLFHCSLQDCGKMCLARSRSRFSCCPAVLPEVG